MSSVMNYLSQFGTMSKLNANIKRRLENELPSYVTSELRTKKALEKQVRETTQKCWDSLVRYLPSHKVAHRH